MRRRRLRTKHNAFQSLSLRLFRFWLKNSLIIWEASLRGTASASSLLSHSLVCISMPICLVVARLSVSSTAISLSMMALTSVRRASGRTVVGHCLRFARVSTRSSYKQHSSDGQLNWHVNGLQLASVRDVLGFAKRVTSQVVSCKLAGSV